MFCPSCGTNNPDSSKFCIKCGNLFSRAPIPAMAPIPGNPSAAAPPPFTGNPTTSGKAIASLICGIFVFFFPVSIAAVILGHMSLSEIRKSAGRIGGQGIAITGLVLGYLGVLMIPMILIIAAIAIPNLLRSRMAMNEASAVGSLRTIDVAAIQYASGYENGFPSRFEVFGYGATLAGNCNRAGLIDRSLASGQKSGYVFTYTPQFPAGTTAPAISPEAAKKGCDSGGASGFTVTAHPLQPGVSGARSFYSDQTGVIRYSKNGESATADSPALE